MNADRSVVDPDDELAGRLRAMFHVVMPLLDTEPVAEPFDDDEATTVVELRPGPRRHRVVFAAVAGVTIAVVVGALVAFARSGTGTPTSAFGEALRASGVLTPASVPSGLRFDSLVAIGPASVTFEPAVRQLVLTDPNDPNHHVRVEATKGGDDGVDWASVTRQLIQTTVTGARGAAFGMGDTGVISMEWLKNGDRFYVASFGVALDDLRTFAAGVAFEPDGSLRADQVPVGFTVRYEGPQAVEGPHVEQTWVSPTGTESLMTLVGAELWSAPSLRYGQGEVVRVGDHNALYYATPTRKIAAWLDPSGRQHQIVTTGLERAQLLDVAAGLVPLDRARFQQLESQTRPGGMINQLYTAARSERPNSATTAVAVGPPSTSGGFVPTAARASDVPLGHAVDLGQGFVVHTLDDRWVVVQTYVEAIGGQGCTVEPDTATDGTLAGWEAPCTGARYAPDGACLNDRCVVGLRTTDVRIVDDRVEIDHDGFHVGIPRPATTG